MERQFFLTAIAAAMIASLIGCGQPGGSVDGHDKAVKVRGKITFQKQPVYTGQITFWPVGNPTDNYKGRGILSRNGTYELSSFGVNDGVLPGEYVVALYTKVGGPNPLNPNAPEKWLVPKNYADREQSPLRATVRAGSEPMQLDFDIK